MPSRPQTFAADESFIGNHIITGKDKNFARTKCGSCCEPLANFVQQQETNEESRERKISVRSRFLSRGLRSYILSDSSFNNERDYICEDDDSCQPETELIKEKDPENDSGHEDDTVFLMENPELSDGADGTHITVKSLDNTTTRLETITQDQQEENLDKQVITRAGKPFLIPQTMLLVKVKTII